MSQLRLGRLPDGTRNVVIQEPAVGRITHARGAIVGGFQVVTETSRDAAARQSREYKARMAAAARVRRAAK
jgi:hypothetical protein